MSDELVQGYKRIALMLIRAIELDQDLLAAIADSLPQGGKQREVIENRVVITRQFIAEAREEIRI